jgi:cation transport ATPase
MNFCRLPVVSSSALLIMMSGIGKTLNTQRHASTRSSTILPLLSLIFTINQVGNGGSMEINVKKVENGYTVRIEGEDPVEGYVSKEFVFTKQFQVIRFLKETFKDEK